MSLPTVVLLGNVGTGKSTLVEHITGISGISSDASESFTRSSHAFVTKCRQLQIIDTPGSNAMSHKVEHNMWIAHALNFAPVSLILMTVKAETRIDNTIDAVRVYAESFQDLSDILGVVVTHMDTVNWKPAEFLRHLEGELGIDKAIFAGLHTPGEAVIADILKACHEPQDLTIHAGNFLKFFKINNQNLKILKCVKDEVNTFKEITQHFTRFMLSMREEKDKVDLVFEFQTYMSEQIIQAQRRVSEANSFTFMGDAMANEAGHIANLTNQLRSVLFDVRTMALGYTSGHGISDLRSCPYCGLIWAKLEGCDDGTTCGNLMTGPDVRDARFGQLATFTFQWDGKTLGISKTGSRQVTHSRPASANPRSAKVGCGRNIIWKEMAPVQVPPEFRETKAVTTDDVQLIPEKVQPTFGDYFRAGIARLGSIRVTEV